MRVFTTRPDTIFGISFCVLSPEHPLVDQITTARQRKAVEAYREQATHMSEIDRMSETREKDGVFTGAYALHPFTGEPVPVWIADYVLMGYGTGAIMAVPAHDTRDYLFARKYDLPIPPVIRPADGSTPPQGEAYVAKDGSAMCNCPPEFDGVPWPESFERVAAALAAQGVGEKKVNYRLRDWLISRQRMWGTPIPIIHCERCGIVPVPYEQLPVVLPDDAVFKPTGESPLKYHEGFLHVDCPRCGQPAQRETDTMDTFICSSWYFYAYLSPYWKAGQRVSADDVPWDPAVVEQWLPLEQYTGGIEHAILHLLYLRFYARALKDAGVLAHREPIRRLFNQGMILGEDNEKMSKSRGNVVAPDALVERYGADTVRAYLMFIGPWDQGGPWSSSGIEGAHRFVLDVWYLSQSNGKAAAATPEDKARELTRAVHQTLRKVSEDYAVFKYNTLLAALMTLRNHMKQVRAALEGSPAWEDAVDNMLLMLAPVMPFVTEELWQRRHPGPSVHDQSWPGYDPDLAAADLVTLVVQINGRIRDKLDIPAGTPAAELEGLAMALPKVQEALQGKTIRKVIPVGNKLVNIVVA
jgi:leucyl-tRNA synthetase